MIREEDKNILFLERLDDTRLIKSESREIVLVNLLLKFLINFRFYFILNDIIFSVHSLSSESILESRFALK